jgi:hypothetical protein
MRRGLQSWNGELTKSLLKMPPGCLVSCYLSTSEARELTSSSPSLAAQGNARCASEGYKGE